MPDRSETSGASPRAADPLPAPAPAADEPMSDAQKTTLQTLCADAGAPFEAQLSTAEATRRISELQKAKDQRIEDARVARGAAPTPCASAAGEEDPQAALNEPKTKAAIQQQQQQDPGAPRGA